MPTTAQTRGLTALLCICSIALNDVRDVMEYTSTNPLLISSAINLVKANLLVVTYICSMGEINHLLLLVNIFVIDSTNIE
jgi:hypothetical protein